MAKWRHRLSNINPENQTATCAHCGPDTLLRWRKTTKKWVCRNQDSRPNHLTPGWKSPWIQAREKFIGAQEGLCEICREEKELGLDHCHRTGRYRAALCRNCNAAIGLLKEDPEILKRAIEYLEVHKILGSGTVLRFKKRIP